MAVDAIPPVWRFQEHLAGGLAVEAPPSLEKAEHVFPLFDAASAADWRAEGPGASLASAGDTVVFSGARGARLAAPPGFSLPGDISHLVFDMAVKGTGKLQVSWTVTGAPAESAIMRDGVSFNMYLTEHADTRTYQAATESIPGWRPFPADSFTLRLHDPCTITFHRAEAWMRERVFAEAAAETIMHSVNGEKRLCLYAHCPASLTAEVTLPPGARFSAGLAAALPGEIQFSIRVELNGATKVISEERVMHGELWRDISVDLGGWSGRQVRIGLEAEAKRGQVALWSNPAIYTARTPELRAREDKPNILLYVVDALRADHLASYGYPHATAPRLCQMAGAGALFERFFSNETSTAPSMATLATGVDATVHAYPADTPGLPAALATFPALLRANGYITAAISENPYTPPDVAHSYPYGECMFLNEHTAALQGITGDKAIHFLERHARRPFFLYVHTMECHSGKRPVRQSAAQPRAGPGGPKRTPAEQDYDESIQFADSNLGRVLDALDELGLAQSTLVVFTSDHGEALGEDGRLGHGYAPYLEQIHVPLILRWPGHIAPKQRITAMAHMVDLTPALLRAGNAAVPEHAQGHSLLGIVTATATGFPQQCVFANRGSATGPRTLLCQNWKYTYTATGETRLTDWTLDPLEHHDLSKANPGIAEDMATKLSGHVKKQRALSQAIYHVGKETAAVELDAEKTEAMRALGYLD